MLIRTLLILLFSLSLFTSFRATAQVYEQGDVIIDAYYGWPNLWTWQIKEEADRDPNFDSYGINIRSFGPAGVKVEYLLTEKLGIGLHINGANTVLSAQEETFDQNNKFVTYYYKWAIPRFRIMPTINIHIGNEYNIDPYFSLGIGYGSMKETIRTNDPDLENQDNNLKLTPISIRPEFGVRYFFIDKVGAHFQMALGGGAIVAAGLSVKL